MAYSGKAIIRAGDLLIQDSSDDISEADRHHAMGVLSFWRASHEHPLELAYTLLGKVAKPIDKEVIVAKRLKRTQSIVSKLKRMQGMKLKTMQDIGGCRAVVKNEKRVRKLVRTLENKHADLRVKNNYIENPKADGYRGIHLTGRFPAKKGPDQRKVEIQIRTKIQHSWATAVEIVDLFTGQTLKSNQGSPDWAELFVHAGVMFSLFEEITPDILEKGDLSPSTQKILFDRLKRGTEKLSADELANSCEKLYLLSNKLDVLNRLDAFTKSLNVTESHWTTAPTDGYALLEIDLKEGEVHSTIFESNKFDEAASKYLAAEKKSAEEPTWITALVSTSAVGGLRQAYPNYYADSSIFLRHLDLAKKIYRIYNPSGLKRAFKKLFN